MQSEWKVVKKEPSDFCADSYPFKATNGGVCSDHKTYAEALRACKTAMQQEKVWAIKDKFDPFQSYCISSRDRLFNMIVQGEVSRRTGLSMIKQYEKFAKFWESKKAKAMEKLEID